MEPTALKNQRGQSMVEFALTLVIILLLLAGVVDLGRAIFTYLSLRDAAQEAASFASYNPSETALIEARACASSNMLVGLCNTNEVDVTTTTTANASGDVCNGQEVSVRVTYPSFQLVTPFLGTVLGTQTIEISALIRDTILVPPCP